MSQVFQRFLAALCMSLCFCAPVAAQFVFPPGSSLDVPAGGMTDLGCLSLDMQGALNLNGGTLSVDTSATFGNGSTVTGTGGLLSIGGSLIASGNLNTGTNSLVLRDGCDSGNTSQISGNIVVQNLTLTSNTGRTFVLPAGANITVLGTLTIQGAPGQNVQLVSASGTAVINLSPGATVLRNFASVPPTVQIGPVPASSFTSIPTLNEYGLALLSLLIALGAVFKGRTAHKRATPHF